LVYISGSLWFIYQALFGLYIRLSLVYISGLLNLKNFGATFCNCGVVTAPVAQFSCVTHNRSKRSHQDTIQTPHPCVKCGFE